MLVGVGQVSQRVDDPVEAESPLGLMRRAVRAAGEDSGAPDLLKRVESVRVIKGIWSYENPAAALAADLGRPNAETAITSLGGNYVQTVAHRSFLEIQAGSRDVILMTGAECGRTLRRASTAGLHLDWAPTAESQDPNRRPVGPDLFFGSTEWTRHEAELARGINSPIQYYAIFENALRASRRESIVGHLLRISKLWEGFSRVAVDNPNAWLRRQFSADEIRTPTPANRQISFPYPKLMNSNVSVDQGAALLMCSLETARAVGVSEDKIVYPWVGTEAWDTFYVSNRWDLHSSPAIRLAGERLFELAGCGIDEIDFLDLYSCFPSAVQVSMKALGVDEDRAVTVTGGLTFAGGPLNNYVMHAVARMVDVLRAEPGRKGLVTANGGLLTKHALCLYSTAPPPRNFAWQNLQDDVDALPRRDAVVDWRGEVEVESYTVMYGADGPRLAHVAGRLDDGRRTWANTDDPDTLEQMPREDFCGHRGVVDGAGRIVF